MIQIKYDEISGNINIEIEPGSESGTMTHSETIICMVGIVGGLAGFLRDNISNEAMNAFFDAIRLLDESALLELIELPLDGTNNQG